MTLTEVSYYSRRMLPFFILIFVVFLIFIYSIKLFIAYLDASKPNVVYTNPVFGKLTKPVINEASSSAGINFTLDTIEGQPITASEAAKVYFIPELVARFGYQQKASLMAKTFGFNTELVKSKREEQDIVYTDDKRKLSINITNYNFRFDYKFENNPDIFKNAIIPSPNEIENKAIDFLKKIGKYPDELAKGKSNIVYLNYDPSQTNFIATPRASEANVVEIDFYRPDIEGFSMVSPSYFNSQNYLVMVFDEIGMQVIRGQIKFFEKSEEQVGVYSLKTGETAWEDLKAGGGLVISGAGSKDITIKKMFTAYFDPDVYQQYLEPVYVFLGDGDFVGYVPAIDNKFITE